jgi:hypothetical protein
MQVRTGAAVCYLTAGAVNGLGLFLASEILRITGLTIREDGVLGTV